MSHMLDDKSIMRVYKAFLHSKNDCGSLADWGAAESHLKKLDTIQESAVALLRNPDPYLLPPSLENKLPLDSPASCWTGEGVVWLAP